MITLRLSFIVVAAAILSGCVSSSEVVVGKTRPALKPDQVKIYLHPPKQFDEVALLEASSKSAWAFTDQGKTNNAIMRLKRRAAKLGANGIILRGVADQYGGSVGSGSAVATTNGSTVTAIGTGYSVPVMHKQAGALAIYVIEE